MGVEGAKGPDGAGIWDQREERRARYRERGGWEGRGEPPPLAATRAHDSEVVRTNSAATSGCCTFTLYWFPPGPLSSEVRSGDWGLQKLPRGVLAAAPRACVASPPAQASPAPFPTQFLPAGSSLSTPTGGRLRPLSQLL